MLGENLEKYQWTQSRYEKGLPRVRAQNDCHIGKRSREIVEQMNGTVGMGEHTYSRKNLMSKENQQFG